MLLDLGLPSALIGGIVLPLLGAVPDSAMIIASGVGRNREQANKEIAVGMGYTKLTKHNILKHLVDSEATVTYMDNFLHITYINVHVLFHLHYMSC